MQSYRGQSPAYPPAKHVSQHGHTSIPAAGVTDLQSTEELTESPYITRHLRTTSSRTGGSGGAVSPSIPSVHHHHHPHHHNQNVYDSAEDRSFSRSMQDIQLREINQERMELHPPYRAAGTSNPYNNNEYNPQSLQRQQSDSTASGPGFCAIMLWVLSWVMVLATMPFSLFICIKVVQEYERAVIFRLGRLDPGSKGPGIFFVLPCIENYTKVDMRSTLFDIPPQEILTKDSVTVSVDAVVYYRIFNANLSVANVENVHHSTRLLAQTTLRNVLGTKALHDLLGDREIISNTVQVRLDESTEAWGIKVERVEVKDLRLPVQLQRAMAAEAEAGREARAKVIAAEGEQKAARALKEAADIIAESPGALQLRYLQTLNTISAEKNSTIIFPIPMDLITQYLHR